MEQKGFVFSIKGLRPFILWFFLIPLHLHADTSLSENCESLLNSSELVDIEAVIEKYLFSEPVSDYILDQLIIEKVNVRYAAVSPLEYEDWQKKEICSSILKHLQAWLSEVDRSFVDKQVQLAVAMGMDNDEFHRLNGFIRGIHNFNENRRLGDQFIKSLFGHFKDYFIFLKKSKILLRPVPLLKREQRYLGLVAGDEEYGRYRTWWNLYASLGVVTTVATPLVYLFSRSNSGVGTYFTGAFLAAVWGVPLVGQPVVRQIYEKTLGRLRARWFLKKQGYGLDKKPQALPATPMLPRPVDADILAPELVEKEPVELEKTIQGFLNTLRGLSDFLKADLEKQASLVKTSLVAARFFGEKFNEAKALLGDIEKIYMEEESIDRLVPLMDELEEYALVQDSFMSLLEDYMKAGTFVLDEINSVSLEEGVHKNKQTRMILALGQRLVDLDETKLVLMSKQEQLQSTMDNAVMNKQEQGQSPSGNIVNTQ